MSDDPIEFSATRYLPGRVSDYEELLDPQRWKTNIGALWKESGIVRGNKADADRTKKPALLGRQDSWTEDRLFYEDVEFGAISRQRNLLKTTLEKVPAKKNGAKKGSKNGTRKKGKREFSSIKFLYRQYECLESQYFLNKRDGGIDVDFGGAHCEQTDDNKVKLTVTKTVRFTQSKHDPLADLIARTSVKFVMELLVLGADKQT
jgi:hypothetical protein